MVINGYVIRKTLDLFFFFFHFSFSLKNKTEQRKIPRQKIVLGVITNILGVREGTLKQKRKAP